MNDIVYLFAGTGDAYPQSDARTPSESVPAVNERQMRQVLNSQSVQMPKGLTREQARSFILAHAGEYAAQA
ncbi:MAG: hypothetical protein WA191_07075 [Telluria sp.]|jgi:hypothetical protein